MPLDPPTANILRFLVEAGAPSLASGTVAQARSGFRAGTVGVRDVASLPQVRSVQDITIPGPAGPIPARVYRPDADGPLPTMAFFHGGGFVIGDIETHDDHARLICRDGELVVVSIDYRLAPEHPFPPGFDDCYAATKWVAANVNDFGGDADRIAVGGDSAGGNLSAVVALAARDAGPRLAAQLLIYPSVDFDEEAEYPSRAENAEGYFLTVEDMQWFGSLYVPQSADPADPRLSPIKAEDLSGVAPTVLGVGEFDPLRDEGLAYAKALADAGVDVQVRLYDGLVHGFFGFTTYSPASASAAAELIGLLRETLGTK